MFLKFDEYVIGLREHNSLFLYEDKTLISRFKIIPKSFFWWYADPFLFEYGGKHYIFVERYNRFTCKGHIAVSEITGKKLKFKSCGKFKYHMSFPFVDIDKNGSPFMIPETMNDNSVSLYVFEKFPYKITKKTNLINNVKNVDSSIIDNVLFSYSLERRETPYFTIYELINDSTKPIAKLFDKSLSLRGAGKPFIHNGKIVYPTQNCNKSYGYGVLFNYMSIENGLSVEQFSSIDAEDVSGCLNKKIYGIHTYNADSKYEVIDLTIKRFSLMSFFGKIINRLRKLGSK